MGPWFVRDEANPFRPGCAFDTLVQLALRGSITLDTVVRGPSTRQFWVPARSCPGLANILGVCHNCQAAARPGVLACAECGASFGASRDRQGLGLGEIRALPGRATPEPGEPTSPPLQEAARSEGTEPARTDTHPAIRRPAPPRPDALSAREEADAGAGLAERPVERALRARMNRFERQFVRARTLSRLWAVLAILASAAIAALFLAPRLRLSLGPIDAWFGRPTPHGVSPEIAPVDAGRSLDATDGAPASFLSPRGPDDPSGTTTPPSAGNTGDVSPSPALQTKPSANPPDSPALPIPDESSSDDDGAGNPTPITREPWDQAETYARLSRLR